MRIGGHVRERSHHALTHASVGDPGDGAEFYVNAFGAAKMPAFLYVRRDDR